MHCLYAVFCTIFTFSSILNGPHTCIFSERLMWCDCLSKCAEFRAFWLFPQPCHIGETVFSFCLFAVLFSSMSVLLPWSAEYGLHLNKTWRSVALASSVGYSITVTPTKRQWQHVFGNRCKYMWYVCLKILYPLWNHFQYLFKTQWNNSQSGRKR